MRASGASISAIDVWDVLEASVLLASSMGLKLKNKLSRYSYSATLLNGGTMVPPDGTIVYHALLDNALINALNDFGLYDPVAGEWICDSFAQDFDGQNHRSMCGPFMCDGVIQFRNGSGDDRTLVLEGLTLG